MRNGLLNLLACPDCHHPFHIQAASTQNDRVRNGELVCSGGHRYPVKEFVPVFAHELDYMKVFSNLRRQPAGTLPSTEQLDVQKLTSDEFAGQTATSIEDLRGKTVLDAGCGGGRFLELLKSCGATIVGMDIDSTGLRRIGATLADNGNLHFVHADLFRLPFRSGAFDFIHSLGVLHHTPDPKGAFLNLARLLKPGGQIAIWVYPKSERTPLSDAIRPITTRIPSKYLYRIAHIVTTPYGPLLRMPRFKARFQAMLYNARLPWHEEKYWRIHSFMDWYGPKYQFKYDPEEIQAWYSEAGLVDYIRCQYETSARGSAPMSPQANTRLAQVENEYH